MRVIAQAELPTRYGRFRIYGFRGPRTRRTKQSHWSVAIFEGELHPWCECTRNV